MITWLVIKSFLGRMIEFTLRYPLQIIIVLLCLYAWHEKTAHTAAVQALIAFKEDIANASTKQAAENAIKHINAQSKVDIAANQSVFDMTRLNLDRTQSTNEMKKLYEDKINQLKRNLANRNNGVLPSGSDTSGTVEASSDTKEPAASTSISDRAAYTVLEKACAITTLDYNLAREWIDAACEISVCE